MARKGYLHSLALRAGGQMPPVAERGQTLRPTNALLRRWEMLATGADDGGAQSLGRGPLRGPARSTAPTWPPDTGSLSLSMAATGEPQAARPMGPAAAGPGEVAVKVIPGPTRLGNAPGTNSSRAVAAAGSPIQVESRPDAMPHSGEVKVEVGRVARSREPALDAGRGRSATAEDRAAALVGAEGEGRSGTLMPAKSRNLGLAGHGDATQAEQTVRAKDRDARDAEPVSRVDASKDVDSRAGIRTPLTAGTIWPRPPDRGAQPEPAAETGPTVHIGTIEVIVTPPANDASTLARDSLRAAPAPAPQAAAPRAPASRPAAPGRLARGYLSTFGLRQG